MGTTFTSMFKSLWDSIKKKTSKDKTRHAELSKSLNDNKRVRTWGKTQYQHDKIREAVNRRHAHNKAVRRQKAAAARRRRAA